MIDRKKPLRDAALLFAAYLAVRLLFGAISEGDGLFSPSGMPRPGVALVGLVAIVLRIGVLVVLPPALAYGLVMGTATRASRRESAATPPAVAPRSR